MHLTADALARSGRIANALRTLLLAEHSGARRICPPGAGRCRGRVARVRAGRRSPACRPSAAPRARPCSPRRSPRTAPVHRARRRDVGLPRGPRPAAPTSQTRTIDARKCGITLHQEQPGQHGDPTDHAPARAPRPASARRARSAAAVGARCSGRRARHATATTTTTTPSSRFPNSIHCRIGSVLRVRDRDQAAGVAVRPRRAAQPGAGHPDDRPGSPLSRCAATFAIARAIITAAGVAGMREVKDGRATGPIVGRGGRGPA